MLKIHIIGGAGSGKTTLAETLGSRFHIPHYDLDKLGWKHGMGPLALYVEEALTIIEQPGWVTEGIYLFWTDPFMHEADYIVMIDIPWSVAVWRVLRRHVVKTLNGTNPYATRFLWPLLKGMRPLYNRADLPPSEFVARYLDTYRRVTEPPASGFTADFAPTYLDIYRQISEPPTEEFKQWYQETYPVDSEAADLDFLRMYHDKFRATVEPKQTKGFTFRYLEKYKEKVYVIKNNADRDHLLNLLENF
ncbi:hypothetical protein [Dictyobacter formicarum]|uniref:Adenylate kinase n=1 Tax=Dictyobacter formicarum TaxID=2778368 RepID=A0ABQ3VSN7_9CHLR|nr:hypothetical protein [Dictyobacter formicarum]GHO89215.1 hypothetical protein KSZ_72210 [Dictyobacter formicarum]